MARPRAGELHSHTGATNAPSPTGTEKEIRCVRAATYGRDETLGRAAAYERAAHVGAYPQPTGRPLQFGGLLLPQLRFRLVALHHCLGHILQARNGVVVASTHILVVEDEPIGVGCAEGVAGDAAERYVEYLSLIHI